MTIVDGFLLGIGFCLATIAIRHLGIVGVLLILGAGWAIVNFGAPILAGTIAISPAIVEMIGYFLACVVIAFILGYASLLVSGTRKIARRGFVLMFPKQRTSAQKRQPMKYLEPPRG